MGARGSKLRKHVGGSSGYAYRRLEGSMLGPRGYVPVCVGVDDENSKRFMVHAKALKDADFCEFLKKSAEEYGFRNDGILKILVEVQDFEDWIIRRYKKKKIMRVKPKQSYPLKQSSKRREKGESM